jgi:fructokinase
MEQAAAAVPSRALRLLDLNLRPPLDTALAVDAALSCANAVKLSEDEADALRERLGGEEITEHLLGGRGMRLVAITRGARGSLVCTAHGRHQHPGVPLDAAGGDAVGAGDAFTAALAHHLARGHAIAVANAAANRYAAFVASRPGAMPDVPPDVRREVTAPTLPRGKKP